MSTRIAHDPEDQIAVLYDSVTGVAFGEIFEGVECYEDAERFVQWAEKSGITVFAWSATQLRDLRNQFADMRAEEQRPEGVPLRGES